MSGTLDLPDTLAKRLEAEAARRGLTVQELAVTTLREHYEGDLPTSNGDEDSLDAFLGSLDSGDPEWASTDPHRLRQDAARRRLTRCASPSSVDQSVLQGSHVGSRHVRVRCACTGRTRSVLHVIFSSVTS